MDWIFGLIAVVAFLVGCVFGYDIGHMKGCEKFLKDQERIEKAFEKYTPMVKAETFEIVPIHRRWEVESARVEHMTSAEVYRFDQHMTKEFLEDVKSHVETEMIAGTDGNVVFEKELKIAVRR